MKQLSLFKNDLLRIHGGEINPGKRKVTRPLSTKHPIHLVLKSNRSISLFEELNIVKNYIDQYSLRFHIKIYHFSIQHDHIHLLIKIEDRESYKKFARSLTGRLARRYGKGLWKLSPFTRIIQWGKDFQATKKYISQNEYEVWGLAPYKKRNNRYKNHTKTKT